MKHERIALTCPGAFLDTYFLSASKELKRSMCRPAVIVCPGGGYAYVADGEAEPIAMALCGRGFHACVLRYPCAPAEKPHTEICRGSTWFSAAPARTQATASASAHSAAGKRAGAQG